MLAFQAFTVVMIQASLKMVNEVPSVQSTPVKWNTNVLQDTHYKDQTEGPASPMESGVEVYLSAIVGSLEIKLFPVTNYNIHNICAL